MKKAIFGATLALCMCGMVEGSFAKTGAELLQDSEMFGLSFVWGAANYMVADYSLNDDAGNRLTIHRAKCLVDSGITAKTLYDSVTQEIRNDPSLLNRPAVNALMIVTFKICGPPPQQ